MLVIDTNVKEGAGAGHEDACIKRAARTE